MLGKKHIFTIVLSLIVISILPARADYKDGSKAIKASGGEDHTLILTADKGAWACGPNGGYDYNADQSYYGVLGTDSDDRYLEQKTLVSVHGPDDYLKYIIDISAGRSGEHSLAVDANGYVYAWGRNEEGQCGNGESGTGYKELVPAQVHGVNDVNYLENIIAVSAAIL